MNIQQTSTNVQTKSMKNRDQPITLDQTQRARQEKDQSRLLVETGEIDSRLLDKEYTQ